MPTPLTVKDVAEKLSQGKDLNKSEKKFYELNSEAVEKELSGISANDRLNISTDANSKTTPASETSSVFNPLKESVDEKSYSGAQPGMNQGSAGVVPEHTYQAPPEEVYEPQKQKSKDEEKQEEARKEKTANPELEGKSDTEKEQGAEYLFELIMNTWATLYKGANKLMMISEKTIAKKQNSGEINTRVEVPYKMGYAPLSQVFQQYNADAKDLLVIEPEWKESIKPFMIEELSKAGHGLSNRQVLISMIGMKVGSDSIKCFQFLSLKKEYLTFAKEQTQLNRRNIVSRPPRQQAQQAQEAPSMQEHEEEIAGDENEVSQGQTLQQQAMDKMFPQNMAGPNFGSTAKLNELNKMYRKDNAETKRAAKETISSVKNKVERNLKNDPAPDGKKRGKGRPPGSKNKPKNRPGRR